MTKIFERRKNFDLRRLLSGSERLFYNLLANDSSSAKSKDEVKQMWSFINFSYLL